MKKTRILVVNGFSSGMMIVKEAKRLGFECFHLSTAMEGVPESYLRHNMASGYDGILERKDRFEDQLALCEGYGFDVVMPGTESGVLLAEKLADALSLPCNDIHLTLQRRDKYFMQKRLADCGIPCIPSALVHSAGEAVAWFRESRLPGIVLKPRMDAGGIGFHYCRTEEEIGQAFAGLYGKKSCFGEDIDTPDVLVQKYITGKEIIVNHVSHAGVHELTDIWAYEKDDPAGEYADLTADSVSVLTEEYAGAVRYAQKVLDALGIRFGPSHSEIMLTEDGPLLIETGARPMGSLPSCGTLRKVFGFSLIEKMIRSYLGPVSSSAEIRAGLRLADCSCKIMFIKSSLDARLAGLPAENILKKCAYVAETRLEELKESMVLERTGSLVTSPGSFVVLSRDRAGLESWSRLYRRIEKEHPGILFQVENGPELTAEELALKQALECSGPQ